MVICDVTPRFAYTIGLSEASRNPSSRRLTVFSALTRIMFGRRLWRTGRRVLGRNFLTGSIRRSGRQSAARSATKEACNRAYVPQAGGTECERGTGRQRAKSEKEKGESVRDARSVAIREASTFADLACVSSEMRCAQEGDAKSIALTLRQSFERLRSEPNRKQSEFECKFRPLQNRANNCPS
jgi:hypothetical protein